MYPWGNVVDGFLHWKGVFDTFTPLRSVIPTHKTVLSNFQEPFSSWSTAPPQWRQKGLGSEALGSAVPNQLPQTPRTLPENWQPEGVGAEERSKCKISRETERLWFTASCKRQVRPSPAANQVLKMTTDFSHFRRVRSKSCTQLVCKWVCFRRAVGPVWRYSSILLHPTSSPNSSSNTHNGSQHRAVLYRSFPEVLWPLLPSAWTGKTHQGLFKSNFASQLLLRSR